MNTYLYKDCSIPIKGWPFWGLPVCEIQADSILEADELFKTKHPELCKKGT